MFEGFPLGSTTGTQIPTKLVTLNRYHCPSIKVSKGIDYSSNTLTDSLWVLDIYHTSRQWIWWLRAVDPMPTPKEGALPIIYIFTLRTFIRTKDHASLQPGFPLGGPIPVLSLFNRLNFLCWVLLEWSPLIWCTARYHTRFAYIRLFYSRIHRS